MKGFVVGLVADYMTYLVTATQLALALRGEETFWSLLLKVIIAFIPIQGPLGLLEGIITGSIIVALVKRRRDLMEAVL